MSRVLGLWGSGEFLPWAAEADRFLLDAATHGNGSVAVLPTASAPEGAVTFDRWGSMGVEHYAAMNVPARVVPLRTREDAHDEEIVRALDDVSLVYFSGGNPSYLAETLRDTPFWRRALELLDRGMALAGCSAGAAMMGEQAPDPARMETIEEVFEPRGLAVIRGYVFGVHWDQVDTYYPNLRHIAIRLLPDACTMVGIDEDTALVTADGDEWRVMGAAGVHVYERGNDDEPTSYSPGDIVRLP